MQTDLTDNTERDLFARIDTVRFANGVNNFLEVYKNNPVEFLKVVTALRNREIRLARAAHQESPAVEGRLDREVRQREPSAHVAWCRYVMKHERPTRIVLCDSDAEGAFAVFRYPHDDKCKNDLYARSVLDADN